MVQRKSRFRNLKRGDGTTQEFVSGTFRSINSNTWSRKKMWLLIHKLSPDSWRQTDPLLCLKFSTWAGRKHLYSLPSSWQICVFPAPGLRKLSVLESRLISTDGATQIPILQWEAGWHNSRVWVWYFQVCKFQFCLLAKYFVSVSNCSCSHIHFVQTVEEKLRNRS